MKYGSNFLLIALAIAVSIGCSSSPEHLGNYDNSRRARLEAELGTLNQERIRFESERARHESNVTIYMMNHKLATAAVIAGVGGAGVVIDPQNEFSDEAKNVGGGLAVLAAIYAVTNWDEVTEVANEITKASLVQSQYKQQLASLDQQIHDCKTQLQ